MVAQHMLLLSFVGLTGIILSNSYHASSPAVHLWDNPVSHEYENSTVEDDVNKLPPSSLWQAVHTYFNQHTDKYIDDEDIVDTQQKGGLQDDIVDIQKPDGVQDESVIDVDVQNDYLHNQLITELNWERLMRNRLIAMKGRPPATRISQKKPVKSIQNGKQNGKQNSGVCSFFRYSKC